MVARSATSPLKQTSSVLVILQQLMMAQLREDMRMQVVGSGCTISRMLRILGTLRTMEGPSPSSSYDTTMLSEVT